MDTVPAPLSIKLVIRCANLEKSLKFYTQILHLTAIERWHEPEGRGCVLSFGGGVAGANLEIYEMNRQDTRFDEAFTQPLENDKVDLQIRTHSLDAWAAAIGGRWAFHGPEVLPWGQRWIKLRDPDHLLIAIYEDHTT